MVILKHRILLQKLSQCFGRTYIIQEPQGVRQLLTQLLRRKGILVIGRKGMKEFLHFLFMNEFSAAVSQEKFIQVKGIITEIFPLRPNRCALFDFTCNHRRHLVSKHGKLRQPFIGIEIIALPIFLGFLLISIGPVVNLAVRELPFSQLLERCAGQIENVVAVDLVKSPLRLVGLHPFLGLIHNKKVEMKI